MKYRMDEITESCLGKMLDAKKNKGEYQPYLANINVRWGSFDLEKLSLMRFEKDEEERYGIKYGDLIMCEGGEPGRCAIWRDELPNMKIQKALHRIRPNTELVDVEYLYYWFLLSGRNDLLRRHFTETTIKHLPGETLKQLVIDLPDMKTQKGISSVLRVIDKKITVNEHINDNLEQQLTTLYDYWFTQFDFPDKNGKPYQSSGGKMVMNNGLKKKIPDGWNVESVYSNKLSSIIRPGVDKFDTKTYFATADVKGTSISSGTLIDYENRENRANMQPSVNSVWFAKMKNSIKHLYLNEEMLPIISSSILSTGFCGLQCSDVSFEYIASYISNVYFETHKDMLAHGATQEAVNNDDLTGIHIVIPDDKTLQNYHRITQPIYSQISKNICENQELVKIRDWLLPMLMNGQATIAD